MEDLDRQDALAFYRTYYAPNNAILIVAGDVTPDQVRQLAETHYGPLEPTEILPPRERPQEPPQLAERRLEMADARVAQPYVMRTYLAPARKSGAQEQAAALSILAELLGGSGTTSVLAKALTFDNPKAVYVSADYDGGALDSGTFSLAIVPVPGLGLAEAERAMDDVVARFLEDGVDPVALERIKTQLRAAADLWPRQCRGSGEPLRPGADDGPDRGRRAGLARRAAGGDGRGRDGRRARRCWTAGPP